MRLLCLSNGHGEDAIALRILQALQRQPNAPQIEALPIVGEGHFYTQAHIPLIGSVKAMPSGGFIYMDGRQLARDIRGGLLRLTVTQWRAIQTWAKSGHFILAVGDIVPLLFAWSSGLPYAFVGTAKSEYYIRDESGLLPRPSWWDDRLQRWTGCIYHPWERWLMSHSRCQAVFPRDRITAHILQRYGIPAVDAGNPMMDGLSNTGSTQQAKTAPNLLTIALIPGSRPPEAYENWEILLLAVNGLLAHIKRPMRFLVPIAPGLALEKFHQQVIAYRWQAAEPNSYVIGVGEQQATLILTQGRFAEGAGLADTAIAMAGTATEQFVGLGKPVVTIPGQGPQFTYAFAEAQTRLLGPSITLVSEPVQAAAAIQSLLANPDRLHLIAENGRRRMGEPGAANRIATHLMEYMVQ